MLNIKTIGAIALTFVMLVSMSDFAYARKRPLDRGRPPKTDHLRSLQRDCGEVPERGCDRRGVWVRI